MKQSEKLPRCKICGKDFENGFKGFCSQTCYEVDLKNRIIDATKNDPSHTQKISKDC